MRAVFLLLVVSSPSHGFVPATTATRITSRGPSARSLPSSSTLLRSPAACHAEPLGRASAAPDGGDATPAPAQRPPAPVRRPPALSRRQALLGGGAALLALAPTAANAAYGPSGASVTSSPPLKPLSFEEWLLLTPEQLARRSGSYSQTGAVNRVLDILNAGGDLKKPQSQYEDLLDTLEREAQSLNLTLTSDLFVKRAADVRSRQETSAKARAIATQLEAKEKMLGRLEAQPSWVVYLCAALGSVGSTLIMHPVDTIKTKLIVENDEVGETGEPLTTVEKITALTPAELYKGILPNVIKESPSSAVYLGVYEVCKGFLPTVSPFLANTPLLVYLLSGAAGEAIGSVVRAPSEAVKVRLQSGLADSPAEAFMQLLNDPSTRAGTIKAWQSSLLRDVPMGAIQIALFEGLKAYLAAAPDVDFDVNTLQAEALIGGLGGLVGALATVPTDVLTTRIITQTDDPPVGPRVMLKRILDEDGPSALFSGAAARGLYWTPAIGIFLSLYCSLRQAALGLI